MDQQPLVSISCITYNHAPFIRQALNSFLEQKTTFPFEIIIHDDASTDGTREIIEEYAKKYPNIIFPYFQIENQYSKGVRGMSTQYNFPRCRGKYIALCEGDDYWTDKTKLQQQVEYLENNEACAGSFHETQQIFENTGALGKIYGQQAADKLYQVDTISTLSPFHTSSFIFRRNAFFDPGFLAEIDSLDMATFSIIAKSGYLKKIPSIMSVYRKHDGSITNSLAFIGRFHENRILLIHYVNKMYNNQYESKALEVIAVHRKAIATKFNEELNQKESNNVVNPINQFDFNTLLPILQNYSNYFQGEALAIGLNSPDFKYFLFSNTQINKFSHIPIDHSIVTNHPNDLQFTLTNHQFPFTDNWCDFIVYTKLWSSEINMEIIVNECYRILRPNGCLLIAIPKTNESIAKQEEELIQVIKTNLLRHGFKIINSSLKNSRSKNMISSIMQKFVFDRSIRKMNTNNSFLKHNEQQNATSYCFVAIK